MNTYVTGAAIKKLREERQLTQAELAEQIGVSSKTISKWETAKGLPDITLLQPLSQALSVPSAAMPSMPPAAPWGAAAASPCRLWRRRSRTKAMPFPSSLWRTSILSPCTTP